MKARIIAVRRRSGSVQQAVMDQVEALGTGSGDGIARPLQQALVFVVDHHQHLARFDLAAIIAAMLAK